MSQVCLVVPFKYHTLIAFDEGARKKMLVREILEGRLVLTLSANDTARNCNYLSTLEQQHCMFTFEDVDKPFSISLTAIVDFVTATGNGYLHPTEWPLPTTGLCLVTILHILLALTL
jgi:hypothetical protein